MVTSSLEPEIICPCPVRDCSSGQICRSCLDCDGEGCTACDESGEVRMGRCAVCYGTGLVPMPTGKVYAAFLNEEARGGELRENGNTEQSLANWWRRRSSFGRIVRLRSHPFIDATDRAGRIEVINQHGELLAFAGFAVGYGGTAPNGLAAVLADSGAFRSQQAALRFVMQLPQDELFTRSLEIR